ncbi:MspA family porin [Gordonia liuliyuniae]|uniref:MspA family porin n=1 Tax=Gordonia liuliyuniae TaxID=2911517 RepID=A0ABS9IY74_9ACTN|nr:MspA family porin [Gordonia liuliyuniae]MCF8590523.1 MspA family porin [Gordonia liuliyuniae]
MSKKATTIARRAAAVAAVSAVGAAGLMINAGDADAARLPSGSKTSTGIDGQVVKLKRSAESARGLHSVANNGAGRSAAVSGTYKATLSKGTGSMTVGYLVGCQVNITGLSGGLSGSISQSGPSLSGALSVPLQPGEVKFIKGDSLALKKGKGTVMVDGFQINVEQCGGYASARSVVQVLAADGFTNEDDAISADSGYVQSTLYGKPFSLN